MNHMGTRELRSDRLLLRRFSIEDAEAVYYNWANDPEVTRYLMWDAHTDVSTSQSVIKSWLESYEKPCFYQWAIVADTEPIGSISVVHLDERSDSAEIGYCLSRKEWGKGMMTEALKMVMGYLFDEVGMHRIHLKHDSLNIGSGRVMIKNNLRYEGTQIGANRRIDGSWGDLILYAMLLDEWKSQKEWQ